MRNLPIAALFATTALIPAAFAQTNTVNVASIDDAAICQELVTYVDENDTDATGMTGERADTIAAGEDPNICRNAFLLATGETLTADAQASMETQATADIEVAVPQPDVNVRQPAPEVAVQQPTPDVNVTPGRPIVTVNQAEPVVQVVTTPPKVTIDMPKPEILVELPDATVDVAMARPRVTVTQPEPTVSVEQGEVQLAIGDKKVEQEQSAPKVNVEQTNATVRVDEAKGSNIEVAEVKPEIRYNAAKPRIEVSESGKPDIQFNQSGDANVRVRHMSADETRAAAAQKPQAEREQQLAASNVQPEAAGQATAPQSSSRMMVSDLMDREVIGADGETLGDVENIVSRGDETYIVIGSGGVLGLGEKQIALPMSEIYFRDDQLFSPATTEDALDEMAEFEPDGYRPLGTDQDVEIILQ